MKRRTFLKSTIAAAGVGAMPLAAQAQSQTPTQAAPDTTAKPTGPVLTYSPVVSGPAPSAITILQPVNGPATGYLEYAVEEGEMTRVDWERAGLLPYEQHVLKFRMPPLPRGKTIRYRVTARPVDFQTAYKIFPGPVQVSEIHTFRTLDQTAAETRFVVWNDTHENQQTLEALHKQTVEWKPDFLMWNGDQTNDIYDAAKMTNQFLAPGGLAIASGWPLAYARGNHDVRGPAARRLADFTGTPGDRYHYAFRSGPVAALVMDTGEDKPDDHPVFGGLAGFEAMRRRQTAWLERTVERPWFRNAPFRILFCHIPLWWSDEVKDVGHWRFSKVCRDAWLPTLEKAGVKLVISGHTHEYKWLPAGPDRPIGQLIGGAPRPVYATIINGHATKEKLTVTMYKLDGKVIQKLEFDA